MVDTTSEEVLGTSPRARRELRGFAQRLGAALRLEPALYEEVEHDPGALGHATAVVAIAGVASGVGALPLVGPGAIVAGLVSAFVGWMLWTAIVWLVGVRLFRHSSDFEELLRTLGFVAAPQLFYVLGLVPVGWVRGAVGALVAVMTLFAFFRAVRSALDIDTGRALFVSALALVAYLGLCLLLGLAWL